MTTSSQRLRYQGKLPAKLTEAELFVVGALADGKTYEEIGEELGVGRAAVANRLGRVRDKLHANNTVQAAVKLAKAGLI